MGMTSNEKSEQIKVMPRTAPKATQRMFVSEKIHKPQAISQREALSCLSLMGSASQTQRGSRIESEMTGLKRAPD
jgi:hypothetical protein